MRSSLLRGIAAALAGTAAVVTGVGCGDNPVRKCSVDSDCGQGAYCNLELKLCVARPDSGQADQDGGEADAASAQDAAVPGDAGPSSDAGCTPTATSEVTCNDGIDDDCDGLIDCADPDCADVVCRAAVDDCDVAEKCTGGVCPPDGRKGDGERCASSCNATCQGGQCVGTSSCDDGSPCTVDRCDSATATCSNTPVDDSSNTPCDDGKSCTTGDKCVGGKCQGTVSCTCGPCHVGACAADGSCTCVPVADGMRCDDGNACTSGETCQKGSCGSPTSTVACTALDGCHDPGTCDPATGRCSNPTKANGASCDLDNSQCTPDTCQNGVCTAASAISCPAATACTNASTCDPTTGKCSTPTNKAGGTSCGMCMACDGAGGCTAMPDTDSSCGGDGSKCSPNTCSGLGVCAPKPGTSTSCGTCMVCDGAGGCTGVANDGAYCAPTSCGAWSGCKIVGCSTVKTRSCTSYSCSQGACVGSTTTDSALCSRCECCSAGKCC